MNRNSVKESVWAAAFAAEAEKRNTSRPDAQVCVQKADWAVGMLEVAFRNDLVPPLATEPSRPPLEEPPITRLSSMKGCPFKLGQRVTARDCHGVFVVNGVQGPYPDGLWWIEAQAEDGRGAAFALSHDEVTAETSQDPSKEIEKLKNLLRQAFSFVDTSFTGLKNPLAARIEEALK